MPPLQAPPSSAPPASIARLIIHAARSHAIDPALLAAVVRAESGFDARAESSTGARGLLQLMPARARALGVSDPCDAATSLDDDDLITGRPQNITGHDAGNSGADDDNPFADSRASLHRRRHSFTRPPRPIDGTRIVHIRRFAGEKHPIGDGIRQGVASE